MVFCNLLFQLRTMNLKLLYLIIWILLTLSSCQHDEISQFNPSTLTHQFGPIEPLNDRPPLSKDVLDESILNKLKEQSEYWWHHASDYELWSAVRHSGSIIGIGYRPDGFGDLLSKTEQINLEDPTWQKAKGEVIAFLQKNISVKRSDIIEYEPWPYLFVNITDYDLLAKVRRNPLVASVELMDYDLFNQSSIDQQTTDDRSSGLGCVNIAANYQLYSTISPNMTKKPWHYNKQKIHKAWTKNQGEGISVGVIDTGVSKAQKKLRPFWFSKGQSTGRSIWRAGTFKPNYPFGSTDGPWDDCGHGTQMAGTIAAPRVGGSILGVAYKSNLYSVRGTNDVVLSSLKEKVGVADALNLLANSNKNVRIISMSIGHPISSSLVATAINNAVAKGCILFCAAGTSFVGAPSWAQSIIVFPANMSNTFAVSGVKASWPNVKTKCGSCHEGSKVDFVVPMEKTNSGYVTHSLTMTDDRPSDVGGSSIATATMAGVAALVWSKYPNRSANAIRNKLKKSADLNSNRHSKFGWGVVDAYQAVQ